MLTAGLLIFVNVVKELLATLMLQPFNLSTLAKRAYRYATEELLREAFLVPDNCRFRLVSSYFSKPPFALISSEKLSGKRP